MIYKYKYRLIGLRTSAVICFFNNILLDAMFFFELANAFFTFVQLWFCTENPYLNSY